ncbi:DUF4232 domain-containing protein [Streptomyces sp. NPDC088354]|uniref:DUF4232 domain-containing protein n=1 Tax=unclassified Streptomyces TaxID=2593676 RepID=UPI0029A8BCEA|nr:DUF4232 domain-containing protein [Streptomyces sp. MI02-7b]MDX3071114.1 DUF4232 domain-containing protein [Streptomyces sp. MI02-7b]
MRRTTLMAAGVATIAAAVLATTAPGIASARATGTAPRPCRTSDVSFYFGGYTADLSRRAFDVTLLAHDGIACTLSDTPQVSLSGPPGQTAAIPVYIRGRGGRLVLRADSPLHASVRFSAPDLPEHTLQVTTFKLSMPDHSSLATNFYVPGETDVSLGGVTITSWTTGIGLGQGEQFL